MIDVKVFDGVNGVLMASMVKDLAHAGTPTRVKALVREWVSNNPDLGVLLGYMYDPLIKFNYKLGHNDYYVDYDNLVGESFEAVGQLLYDLHMKNIVGNAKEEAVNEVLELNPLLALFLRKNLDVGFGVTSAKELGIISSHNPQKGVLLTDYDKLQYPLWCDFKYNGIRLSVIVRNGTVECKLLKGNTIKIPVLEDILRDYEGCTFDGELVYTENTKPELIGGITETDRITVSGKVTSATANNAPLSMNSLAFVVYDLLDSENFIRARKTGEMYNSRRTKLEKLINTINNDKVRLSLLWSVASDSDLKALIDWNKSIGGEGFMLKTANSTYDYRKNSSWYKIKHFKEMDLKIIDYKVHSRRPDWIGSLLCYGIMDNKQVLVQVGSGLNDQDRHISKFADYKDKIVMVTYMDIVRNRNKKGVYSLTNPRFAKDTVERPLIEIIRPDGNNINA